MQVDKVTATVKYTQDTGKGAWKSVELGAEATVAPGDAWRVAQANLYRDLGCQLKTLWAQNGTTPGRTEKLDADLHQAINGEAPTAAKETQGTRNDLNPNFVADRPQSIGRGQPEIITADRQQLNGRAPTSAARAASQNGHFCAEHNQEFKQRTGPHGEFYSHQVNGTREWCNEAKR